jgi:hypothetical protein
MSERIVQTVRRADEFFFTPSRLGKRYIALAHSRNYGLPALPRAFFCLEKDEISSAFTIC